MNEDQVLKALQQSVMAAVAASPRPTIPVKYINVTFNKPDDGIWLELIHIPNNGADITWGNEQRFRGLFRIVLHWPNDGSGSTAAMQYVDSIVAYYSKYNAMNYGLRLMNRPRLSDVLEEDIGLILPVTLEYIAFSA